MTDDEKLVEVYRVRKDLFMHDNNRIWFAGVALVPASILPFAYLYSGNPTSTLALVGLALASTGLLIIWNIFSDAQRSFQDVHFQHLTALEKQLGVEEIQREKPRISARQSRWALPVIVAISWSAIVAVNG